MPRRRARHGARSAEVPHIQIVTKPVESTVKEIDWVPQVQCQEAILERQVWIPCPSRCPETRHILRHCLRHCVLGPARARLTGSGDVMSEVRAPQSNGT